MNIISSHTEFAKPRGHLRVAKTHLALCIFYGVLALGSMVFGFFTLGYIPWALVVILTLFTVLPHFLLFKGASATKTWARYGSIGIGVLMLFLFPFGTAIGIFMIINATMNWEL